MRTTSEKLTYLNTTKEKIRDSINLTGANIGTSDTFRSYASKLKLGYIDIINNGIDTLYNNFPKVSGIGSNLSLTPTYEATMKLNEIQGDTLQDGTPTPDSPVPIESVTGLQNVEVCGKNLINSVAKSGNRLFFNGGTDAGVGTFKAGTYTISYTSQNTITTYIKNTDGTQTNLGTDKTITFTSNKDFDLWLYRSGITVEEVSNIQLEKGSTATTYEPYKGNTYEVNLGKNLFDGVVAQGEFNVLGNINTSTTIRNYSVNYIPVIPNENYVSNYNINRMCFYDSNKTFISRSTNYNFNTFTIPSNAYYIRFDISVDYDTDTMQIEKGSTSTSFSPYFTPIELNKIGDYKDRIYKDNGKWYLEKQIGKVVLNGSETQWARWFSTPGVYSCSNLIQTISSNETINCISNYYSNTYNRAYVRNHLDTIDNNIATTGGELIIANKNYTALSDFKTWLSTYNTTVYTILATPTYTEITNTELIEDLETLYTAKSQEGTTNISITSEDLEMILNVSALKGEV